MSRFKNLRFLRHKEMRHITSSRLKQSSFLLDRLHKLKAWSRRKFPVEEQGKPICVPNELCSNISTPSHAFCPWHLLCLACSSAPTYSASRHFNASCSASCRASRNLMPFPSFQETTARFLSKEVCKKVMDTPTKRVSVSFLHKRGPGGATAPLSVARGPQRMKQADVFSTT